MYIYIYIYVCNPRDCFSRKPVLCSSGRSTAMSSGGGNVISYYIISYYIILYYIISCDMIVCHIIV